MDGVLGDPNFGIWGIYDGHLGSKMSDYLSKRLINEFVRDFEEAGRPTHLTEEFFGELFT